MRRLLILLLFAAFHLMGAYPNGYAYRRAITVDHTKVSADVTDFPVLVSGSYSYLAHTTHSGLVTDLNGYDIAFYSDAAGTTALYWEIESYNHETGAIVFWVKSSLSSSVDTVLYMFYGNALVSTFQSTATSVWSSGFAAVYHLGDGTTLSVSDSTSAGKNGTNNGATAAAGKLGGGADFNADYISLPTNIWSSNALTLSAWVNLDSYTSYATIVEVNTSDSDGMGLALLDSSNKLWGGAFGNKAISATDAGTQGVWHQVAVVSNGTTLQLYVDGATSGTTGATEFSTFNDNGSIGARIGGSYAVDGKVDEVRFVSTNRSGAWIASEYANQNDPSTFYAVGTQAEYSNVFTRKAVIIQ
jgi:hypothetical protein